MSEVEAPPVHGTYDPAFAPVADAFRSNFVEHGERGAAVTVIIGGSTVVDLWAGPATDRSSWCDDTLVDVYSVGKAVASTLVLQLVDQGLVGLDDPVARHWPEFAVAGKEAATIRQLLCHRVGLPAIREPLTNEDLYDFDLMVGAVARTAPWWVPGERHAYHTNTYGHLTGGLLHAVTGQRPGERLASLDVGVADDLFIGVPDSHLERCADVVWAGATPPDVAGTDLDGAGASIQVDTEQQMVLLGYVNPPGYSSIGVVNDRRWRQAEIPSTNTHGTARGVARFYDALLDGSLLGESTLAEATRVQSEGWCPVLGQEVTFGLGFQPWTPARQFGRTPGGFGHFGTGGSLGFADPQHQIAFGYVMNHVIPRWQSPRNRALVDAVYASLDA